jgi:hypothetical protein
MVNRQTARKPRLHGGVFAAILACWIGNGEAFRGCFAVLDRGHETGRMAKGENIRETASLASGRCSGLGCSLSH